MRALSRGLHFKVSSSMQSTAQAGAGAGALNSRAHLDGTEGREAEGGRGHGERNHSRKDREDPHCTGNVISYTLTL